MKCPFSLLRYAVAGLVAVTICGAGTLPVEAQERPGQTRTYVPPEQMVSFRKNTPLDQFIRLINPIFKRERGKRIVDPENRTFPIGVPIAGMHYFDAFEKVLQANNLTYEETETVFLIQQPKQKQAKAPDTTGQALATLGTREIRINAILFNLNLTKVRNLGLRWDEILSSRRQQGGGGGTGGGQVQQGTFAIKTDNLFESVDNILQAPEQITLGRFRRFLNLLEQENVGQTIANPQITVQSGEQGRIQIGQDIPIQTQDFAGNTVTRFFETGIIIEVTPTLISQPVADTSGAPIVDFIHLDVRVEDSNSQPTASGPVINRNEASTQVLLLDGEATALGGLISTQKTTTRSGVPILKDLPGWFLGLRYIFGNTRKNITKQELVIMLQAEVVDPLRVRARRQYQEEVLDERRRNAREALRKLGERYQDRFPKPKTKEDQKKENGSGEPKQ